MRLVEHSSESIPHPNDNQAPPPLEQMVCSKCQKAVSKTELATPGVKRKNEMHLGSSTGENSRAATNGIGKVTFLPPPTQEIFCALIRAPADTKPPKIEQTSKQRRKESIRGILELVRDLQDEDGEGAQVLPTLRL
jgi:hypothetical protein